MSELATRPAGGIGKDDIEGVHQTKVLDTPRTKEACKKLGLIIEDLQIRSFGSFCIPGDKKELQTMRFEHYEKKRKERLAQVLAERAKVIASASKRGEVPGAGSGQFLGMLETLFEKEAKRLESDLKSQLRQHSSLVKANDEQLRKEEQMSSKMEMRDQKIKEIDSRQKDHSAKVKEKTDIKLEANALACQQIKDTLTEKKVNQARALLAEQERMERFNQEKALMSAEKSGVWKDKVERMRLRGIQMQEDKRKMGESNLIELESKIQAVSANRDREQQIRIVRSEEQHLHLMDVRAQKDRIDRVDGHRKTELKEQIGNNVERIETLLALKDQLLDQRKARTMKAEATRGARGLNLGRDCGPGPGQYEAPKNCMHENPGVTMSKGKSENYLDMATKATRANPDPGAYEISRLANGDLIEKTGGHVKISQGKKKSFLDDAIASKASVPAPGTYTSKSSLDDRHTKMARPKVDAQGLDKHSAKRFPVWARPGEDTPGPAGYSVDDFTRKEVMRRAKSSLPALTRDMLRPPKAESA